jgi:hypothetical protein
MAPVGPVRASRRWRGDTDRPGRRRTASRARRRHCSRRRSRNSRSPPRQHRHQDQQQPERAILPNPPRRSTHAVFLACSIRELNRGGRYAAPHRSSSACSGASSAAVGTAFAVAVARDLDLPCARERTVSALVPEVHEHHARIVTARAAVGEDAGRRRGPTTRRDGARATHGAPPRDADRDGGSGGRRAAPRRSGSTHPAATQPRRAIAPAVTGTPPMGSAPGSRRARRGPRARRPSPARPRGRAPRPHETACPAT